MGDAPFLLLFHTMVESLAYLFSQDQIVVIHGVIGNGLQLGDIHLAVFNLG